jgi:hypothetical protein
MGEGIANHSQQTSSPPSLQEVSIQICHQAIASCCFQSQGIHQVPRETGSNGQCPTLQEKATQRGEEDSLGSQVQTTTQSQEEDQEEEQQHLYHHLVCHHHQHLYP